MPLNTKAKTARGLGQLNELARLSQNNPIVSTLTHNGVVLLHNGVRITHAR